MKIDILGVGISNVTLTEALAETVDFLNNKKQQLIFTPNPEMLVAAFYDEDFKRALNRAGLAIPDGTGLIFASIFLRKKLKARVTGVDFVWSLLAMAEKTNKSVYLLGGKPDVGRKAAEVILKRRPNLKIVGVDDGGVVDPNKETPKIIEAIVEAKPDILLVAFGHGKQEKWLMRNIEKLPGLKIGMGVGGTFDFIAGDVKRAPKIIRRLGLEWLWRFILEPWRWKRILIATCKFSYLVVKYRK